MVFCKVLTVNHIRNSLQNRVFPPNVSFVCENGRFWSIVCCVFSHAFASLLVQTVQDTIFDGMQGMCFKTAAPYI